jgi:hypothetical protein
MRFVMKVKLLAALLLTPVVAVIDWQVLVSLAWWWGVVMGLPLVGVAVLLGARTKRWPSGAGAGFVLLSSGIVGGVLAFGLTRMQADDNIALGDQVAVALGKHWVAHASYPGSLAELVPEYLEVVPAPSSGLLASAPFWYMPSDREGKFVLGYQAMYGLAAMRSDGKWSAVPLPW